MIVNRPANDFPHLSPDDLKNIDDDYVNHYSGSILQLMECAGFQVARCTLRCLTKTLSESRILIAIGKGHNGADGMVAARYLANWGGHVTIGFVYPETELMGVVKHQWDLINTYSINTVSLSEEILDPNTTLIIDGLLGTGAKGPPRHKIAPIIDQLNESHISILSIDIPSGLDADTGEIYTPCIKANTTLSLAAPKKGYLKKEARTVLGNCLLADIGLPPDIYKKRHLSPPMFTNDQLIRLRYK